MLFFFHNFALPLPLVEQFFLTPHSSDEAILPLVQLNHFSAPLMDS